MRRLLVIIGVLLATWTFVPIRPAVVRGESMLPTLKDGQFFWLDRGYFRTHPVMRGDVIVFQHEGVTYVKRVYALGGDSVWVLRTPDGIPDALLTPGKEVERLQRLTQQLPGMGRVRRITIPEGFMFLVGDGGNCSFDSRNFGAIPESDLVGLARY